MASLKANFFIFHAIFEIFLFVLFSFCMRGILFVNGLPSIGNFQKISDFQNTSNCLFRTESTLFIPSSINLSETDFTHDETKNLKMWLFSDCFVAHISKTNESSGKHVILNGIIMIVQLLA